MLTGWSGSAFSNTGETPTFMSTSRPSMGVPGMVNSGSFQTGFSYQQNNQAVPQGMNQQTRPFQPAAGTENTYGNGQAFQTAPQQPYQPMFNNNGQVTGQTGGFSAIPQTQNMATDNHGVPGFLHRKK